MVLPLVNMLMHPAKGEAITISKDLLVEETAASRNPNTPAEKLEESKLISLFVVALGGVFIVNHFITNGFSLDLNIVNLIFMILGVLFHVTPMNYVKAINEAVKGAGGVLLQFPFYAGIMGIMTGANLEGLSLAGVISQAFVGFANEVTFPLLSFLSAGIVNFFVPSGGGQWAVQAPIMMPAGQELGVLPSITAMSIAWGDAWTNLLQPFWALPALGIAKLGARDIMGYCVMALIVTGVIICVGFVIAGVFIFV